MPKGGREKGIKLLAISVPESLKKTSDHKVWKTQRGGGGGPHSNPKCFPHAHISEGWQISALSEKAAGNPRSAKPDKRATSTRRKRGIRTLRKKKD